MGAPEAPAYGAPTADSPVDEFEVIDDISIKKNQGTLTRGGTATAGETSSETSVIGESEVVGGYETHKTGDKLLQEDLQKGTASEEAAQGQGEDVSKPSEELLREAKDLDLSMEKFENAYASASKTVQDAFILNYMPESARGPSTSPTDFFRRQVEISKVECQTGRLTSTESENALMDIQLVRNILEAASSRIELLRELEMLCDSSGIGSALLGKKAVPLPPAGALASDPNQATFEDFTLMLKGFKFRINEAALAAAGTVPVVLAQRLAASVKLETAQLENDRKVHSSFQKFILSLPQDKQQLCIVHANAIFGVEPFFQVIGRAIFDREANILTADALGSWVVDWNVEGILERLRLNEEDVGKLLGMRPNSYKATSIDDMFAAATALI
ncbi:hypothetical protein, conserved [Eimeria maxima]|uniref:Uncharacterized protein n=1 Tax=Eimeria maxima TaxID=5804 RepID=U6M9J5_EIMMA|nr:hypothetical protein, conserved [Eimeria maxima]CDJ58340.1 hypothetical protein, conserved [Eimeria maxima]